MNQIHSEAGDVTGLLAALAHEKVMAALRRYGTDVGATHELALRQLMEGMSNQGLGVAPGRFAYGLPPGTGKTQSVIAWIAAARELRLGLSVAVSAAQIEALCVIKRDLIAAGVPEEDIGLTHSYGMDASEPDTGDDDRPIMLVSHSRIRGGRNAALFSHHLDRVRDLLIWDETLMTANAESLSWREVKSAVELIQPELAADSGLSLALQATLTTLAREVASQEHAPPSPSVVIEGIDIDAAQTGASALWDGGGVMRRASVKTVRSLMRMIERPVSVALTRSGASGEGVIRYTVAVDPGLANIVVLDASHPIRLLARNGGISERTTSAMRECKSYERVSVCEVNMPAGKSSLSTADGFESVAARVAEVVRSVPVMEHVLLVTFKGDDERFPARLKARLKNHEGIDVDAQIDGRPKIEVLTWGRETSINTMKHCKHVILAGVLRRSQLDLAAQAAATAGDLAYRLSQDRQAELLASEMAHCVLQAMNRGSCRVMTSPGIADEMHLTIIGRIAGVEQLLLGVLPGVRWVRLATDRSPRPNSRIAETARAIKCYLRDYPREHESLPICKLRAAIKMQLTPLGRDSWRVALKDGILHAGLPIGTCPARWQIEGPVLRRAH